LPDIYPFKFEWINYLNLTLKIYKMHRKEFLRNTGLAAASLALASSNKLFAASADTKVKMGIIGVGQRGLNHLDLLLRRDDVELQAI
jgi:hypothetical protein